MPSHQGALKWLRQTKVYTCWVLLVTAAAASNAKEQQTVNRAIEDFRRRYPSLNPASKKVIYDLFVLPHVAKPIYAAIKRSSEVPLYVNETVAGYANKGCVSFNR